MSLFLLLLWRYHCTRQPLVCGCSPHSPKFLRHACGLLKCRMQFFAVLNNNDNNVPLTIEWLVDDCLPFCTLVQERGIHCHQLYVMDAVSFVFFLISQRGFKAHLSPPALRFPADFSASMYSIYSSISRFTYKSKCTFWGKTVSKIDNLHISWTHKIKGKGVVKHIQFCWK